MANQIGLGGFGNRLSGLPGLYYGALLAGRDIIINDVADIGFICNNIFHCGLPTISQMNNSLRSSFDRSNKRRRKIVKPFQFKQLIDESNKRLTNSNV